MDLLVVPDGAAEQLRKRFGLKEGEKLRVTYLSGTGDVVGTYRAWREGRHDPRVAVITYSAMFYELIDRLDARAQIITSWEAPSGQPDDRLEFKTVARRREGSRLTSIGVEAAYTRECVEAVNAFAPHLVVADSDFSLIGWRRLRKGRKLVVSVHNAFWPMGRKPRGVRSRLKAALLRSQAGAIDAAVCTSQECARQVSEITDGRVTPLIEFPQVVERYADQPRAIARKLLFLGRIEKFKGVFLLLDAFMALLPEDREHLELVFAGSGSAEAELARCIEAIGQRNIRFLGRLDGPGVHQEIAAADLVICPTKSTFNEGLALVGFEAAAHGIPALVSSVVPAAEALGCAVFQADSQASLVLALERLTNSKAQYQEMKERVAGVRDALYDRSMSWGSQLCKAMTSL